MKNFMDDSFGLREMILAVKGTDYVPKYSFSAPEGVSIVQMIPFFFIILISILDYIFL